MKRKMHPPLLPRLSDLCREYYQENHYRVATFPGPGSSYTSTRHILLLADAANAKLEAQPELWSYMAYIPFFLLLERQYWVPRYLFKSLSIYVPGTAAALAYCTNPGDRWGWFLEQLVEWRLTGETEVLGENLPQRHFVHHKLPHDQTRARTPDRRGGKPATNRLSYGAAP
jgi:hypothetical protein